MIIFRRVEEIRKLKAKMTQAEFAKLLNMTSRSYLMRTSPASSRFGEWKIEELITISTFNGGHVKIDLNGHCYNVTIHEDI